MTQKSKVLDWLRSHDGITSLEASDNLRVCRLSERIRELERADHVIDHDPETSPNGHHIVRYRLQRIAYG